MVKILAKNVLCTFITYNVKILIALCKYKNAIFSLSLLMTVVRHKYDKQIYLHAQLDKSECQQDLFYCR